MGDRLYSRTLHGHAVPAGGVPDRARRRDRLGGRNIDRRGVGGWSRPQLPLRLPISGKNISFHEAGSRFVVPTRRMNLANFIVAAGVMVHSTPGPVTTLVTMS